MKEKSDQKTKVPVEYIEKLANEAGQVAVKDLLSRVQRDPLQRVQLAEAEAPAICALLGTKYYVRTCVIRSIHRCVILINAPKVSSIHRLVLMRHHV